MKSVDTDTRFDAMLRDEPVSWRALDMSPDAVLDACAELEIAEIVHHQLARAGGQTDWPAEVRAALIERAHASAARELVRGRETRRVLERLATHGIRPILLKGAPLAHAIYASPALRPHADTDLLVRRDDIAMVRDVLIECGYQTPVMSEGELVFRQFQMSRTDEHGVQHVFDVHWSISTQVLFADVLTYDELDRTATRVPQLGPHARCASPIHALLLACIHPVMHHRGSDRLIWIYDIHLIVRTLSETELTEFAQLARQKKVAAICAARLTAAVQRFHTGVPAGVMTSLSAGDRRERSSAYLRPRRHWHDELLSNVGALQRGRDRLTLLREVLLPSPRYMLSRYGLGPVGVALLPALYLHRLALGGLKVVTGRK